MDDRLEIERLRGALIAMGRMLPGVILDDRVSTAFLCELPAELGHYRLVSPSQALADTGLRLAGVKEGLEMAAKHLEVEAVAYRHGQEHANSPGDKLYRMGQKDACLLEATAIRAIPVKADDRERA